MRNSPPPAIPAYTPLCSAHLVPKRSFVSQFCAPRFQTPFGNALAFATSLPRRSAFRHFACALLSLLLLSPAPARAADSQLWGALLMATNHTPANQLPAELTPYQNRLAKVFGYTSFQVIGKSSRAFSDGGEQWLIPGKTFSVRSMVKPTSDANFQVDLQLFQAKKELVQTVAKLGPSCPLFIRGPLSGDGQLIIAIMVR